MRTKAKTKLKKKEHQNIKQREKKQRKDIAPPLGSKAGHITGPEQGNCAYWLRLPASRSNRVRNQEGPPEAT